MEFSIHELKLKYKNNKFVISSDKYNNYVEKEYFEKINPKYITFNYKNNNELFGIYKSPTQDKLYYCYQKIQSKNEYDFWMSFSKQPILGYSPRVIEFLPLLKDFSTGCYSFREVLRLNYEVSDCKLYVVFAVSADEEYIKKGKIYPIDIEMCYTLSISTNSELPMSAHMGIFRSCYYYKDIDPEEKNIVKFNSYDRISDSFEINKDNIPYLKDKTIHSRISAEIHKFGFFITKILNSNIKFMKFNPIENAKEILKGKLTFKEKNDVNRDPDPDSDYIYYIYNKGKYKINWLYYNYDDKESIEIEFDKNNDLIFNAIVDGSKRKSKKRSKKRSKRKSKKHSKRKSHKSRK